MSTEKRLLLAFAISAAIIGLWTILFPPKPVTPMKGGRPGAHETAPVQETPSAVASTEPEAIKAAKESPPPEAAHGEPIQGETEQSLTIENELFKVVLTNRGGAVSSIVLKRYDDDEGRPLELVKDVDLSGRLLPLQLLVDGKPDDRLYAIERDGETVRLRWSDGAGNTVEKTVGLAEKPYTVNVQIEEKGTFSNVPVGLGTGMRNIGPKERENRFSKWGDVVLGAEGKPKRIRHAKVKEERTIDVSALRYFGFEDTYFLMVLRPAEPVRSLQITPFTVPAPQTGKKKKKDETILRLAAVPSGGRLEGELFTAPKEYDLLQKVDQGIEATLHFGIFHPISVLFLKALRWIHGWAGNWGLAIVLLTLLIRIALFPLMHTSTVSMRKMQKIQPKVKAIQEKYKKAKKDPAARAKMNQEVMELYKVEGVNPMGGCLPMLIQLPILWALYTLFAYAIELRHAPFIFWITDLSAKDPYYITPVLMTFTMWLQQKLAPQAGDPQQQKMFRMMPFIFGFMFMGFPAGLVLYWLVNNVLTIIQQEVTLHLMGERKRPGKRKARTR